MARLEVIKMLLWFASFVGIKLYQLDVEWAFLNEYMQEVYAYQPPDLENPDYPNQVFKLHKTLCGLK